MNYRHLECQIKAAGIEADVHQSRHWLVTRQVRDIYETSKNTIEVEGRLRDLIDYMKWKSEETLIIYEHYFKEQHNADKRTNFQQKMHAEVQRYLEERQQRKRGKPATNNTRDFSTSVQKVLQYDEDPDLAFLYSLGGKQ